MIIIRPIDNFIPSLASRNDLHFRSEDLKYVVEDKPITWKIIDIPDFFSSSQVFTIITQFLNGIYAIEVPTSLMCNLNCKYCYIKDGRLKNKQVSPTIVRNIIQTAFNLFPNMYRRYLNKIPNEFIFSSWGAEPFANVKALSENIDLFKKYRLVLSLSTNGTILTDELKTFILELMKEKLLHKSIQVSLDGPPEIQNKYRTTKTNNPTFNLVKSFITWFRNASKQYNNRYHLFFSSTIMLSEHDIYHKAVEFFWTDEFFRSEVAGVRPLVDETFTDNTYKEFVEQFEKINEIHRKLVRETHLPLTEFYTSKLFLDGTRYHGRASFCSAMSSQIGIDIDGSMYMCHGPITAPGLKSDMWYGNIFEKVLSFNAILRNLSYHMNIILQRAYCTATSCPLIEHPDIKGFVCFSCPVRMGDRNRSYYCNDLLRCKAYKDAFKYWLEMWNRIRPIINERMGR